MLTQKMINFYESKQYDIGKMEAMLVSMGYSLPRIYATFEHCYTKISDGKLVHDADIFRYIKNVARIIDADSQHYAGAEKLVYRSKDTINRLRHELYRTRAYAAAIWMIALYLIYRR